jgi:hypothetical protein
LQLDDVAGVDDESAVVADAATTADIGVGSSWRLRHVDATLPTPY